MGPFSKLKALLDCFWKPGAALSLVSAVRSLPSALCCWGAWGAWELIFQIKSLTWKLFLGGQELLSALCFLLSALSAFCSLLSALCSLLSAAGGPGVLGSPFS